MSSLKIQIAQLRKDFKNYSKSIPAISLDNGNEIRVKPGELISALCSIGTEEEHKIVSELRGRSITSYTGSGNIPALIKSIIDSVESYNRAF